MSDHGKDICLRCLSAFSRLSLKGRRDAGSKSLLDQHKEFCDKKTPQREVYPSDLNSFVTFSNYEQTHPVPFVVYADIESILEPIGYAELSPENSFTVQYQRHRPSGFCYTIKCFDESVYKTKTVQYTMMSPDEDIGRKFVESLESELPIIYQILKTDVGMRITPEDETDFGKAERCYACDKPFHKTRYSVRDHCHLTGSIVALPEIVVTFECACPGLFPCCSTIWRGMIHICSLRVWVTTQMRTSDVFGRWTRGIYHSSRMSR